MITEQSLGSIVATLSKRNIGSMKLFTGIGGVLTYNFEIYGRKKLPRKLKKKLFKTEKMRRKYIPQYYAKKTNG